MRSLTSRSAQRAPALGRRPALTSGIPVILVGLLSYALSNAFDGGFLGGFFLGTTIALMVLGAYLVGAGLRSPRKGSAELGNGRHWLPSRDGRGDEPR